MSELVLRTDRFDNECGKGGCQAEESSRAPSVPPLHHGCLSLLTHLLPISPLALGSSDPRQWGYPFTATWEPPSQTRPDSLIAPLLVVWASSFPM